MKFPSVPNNILTTEINELIHLCELKENELAGNTFFEEALSKEAILKWEQKTNVSIPDSYKAWLQYTSYCQIHYNLAEFYSPDMFTALKGATNVYIQIGKMIGDGEMLCYGANDGKFYRLLDGYVSKPIASFKEIILDVIRMLGNTSAVSEHTMQDLLLNGLVYDITNCNLYQEFNTLEIPERKFFLSILKDEEYNNFLLDMRRQSVVAFWNNERELVQNGQCTRDWTMQQIESILNINTETGMMGKNAGIAMELDTNGDIKQNEKGKHNFYIARHMVNVVQNPEYVTEWRSLQALDGNEYIDSQRG